jgi:Dullard-like phosphatase family protein
MRELSIKRKKRTRASKKPKEEESWYDESVALYYFLITFLYIKNLILWILISIVVRMPLRIFHMGKRYISKPGSEISAVQLDAWNYYRKKILVLDLDGTLIHCSPLYHATGLPMKVYGETLYLVKRPYVDQFLEAVSKLYDLAVFTASTEEYADKVIELLKLSHRIPIERRYYRNNCMRETTGKYIKDLTLVDRDLSKVILMDNNPCCFKLQPRNGLAITTWVGRGSDSELIKAEILLKSISKCYDVRTQSLELVYSM